MTALIMKYFFFVSGNTFTVEKNAWIFNFRIFFERLVNLFDILRDQK